MITTFSNYILDILWPDNTLSYFWTGLGDLTFSGNTYVGTGELVTIQDLESTLDLPDRRIKMSISAIPVTLRNKFIEATGRVQVTISIITSSDGHMWSKVPRQFVGIVRDPELSGTTYSFNVVEESLDVDYGKPIFWSHEDQITRYPGDLGMEHVKDLASGFELTWPP